MANVIPKLKMFLFISFISLTFNIFIFAFKNSTDIGQLVLSSTTAFLPFVDLMNLAFTNLPIEATLLFGVVISLLGVVKLFLLLVMIANFVPFENV